MSKRISGQVTPTGSPQRGDKYTISQSTTGLTIGFREPFDNPPVALVTASSSDPVSISTEVDQYHLELAWSGDPDFFTFYVTIQGLGYND